MNLIKTIDDFKLKYVDTNKFIEDNKLSAEVLNYYVENYEVNWSYISAYQTLSESFIDRYIDKLNWYNISVYQTLSETFIEKYKNKNKVDWWNISKYQTLSETFIEKYKNKVDWLCISKYQTLSESFIERYSDIINWYSLFDNKKITLRYDFIVQHLYEFNLYSVCIAISNVNINRLIKEFPEKYQIDKIAHEFNK